MPKNIIAANWKMNNDEYASKTLTYDFLKLLNAQNNHSTLKLLCVPYPYLSLIDNMCKGNESVKVGAQNCSSYERGAFTGEVSTEMLKSLGIEYVIIGHSERREFFSEDNKTLHDKVELSLANKITPIFCCGEPLEVRNNGNHKDFVLSQLQETIYNLSADGFSEVIIAYEPIWAIGSGMTASVEDIQEMHSAIRSSIKTKYGSAISRNTSILYGGSVKPINAKDIFDLEDVNGGLIGGASLVANDFFDIVNSIS
tara:strand:+ start:1429 stop:2193 length:765 start_codon:yes stop_codon:yes gene_type:complete